ncbi:MAG: thiamine-phosphate kinase, partial [Acidimicrobiales bacterium]
MSDATGASEFAAIDRIAALLAGAGDGGLSAPPPGELWIGDDAALVRFDGTTIAVSADALVEGVHFDLSFTTIDDAGWKALAVNVSDIAAMGCVASRAVVTVSGPADTDLDGLYAGLADAARAFGCPVVGGDLPNAPTLVVTVTVLGDAGGEPPPVTRAGACAGDAVWVTGPLGAAAAALHARRRDPANA